MGEISLEASAVSRFIVSLSKSIQALCHGCMDFDDSIEMIGYININIDSGKTVDCVLNEKVRRSAANSMTCISNSFQAKKEKPKQTKDGSCSPMPAHEYSFHQQSPHKRPHRNDFNSLRGHPRKKHRFHAKAVLPYPEHYSSPDTSFHEQSSITTPEFTNTPQQLVKTEAHDNVTPDFDNAASTSSEHFFVKEEQVDAHATDTNVCMQETQDNIEPSAETNVGEQSEFSETSRGNSNLESGNVGPFESVESDNVEPESSFLDTAADDSQERHNVGDTQQPHGSQEDAGDDSNFEVIEIGDDDEEMQGLFDPAGAREVSRHQGQHQRTITAGELYQWTTNCGVLSPPEFQGYMERERKNYLAKLYRSNRSSEQRERDRRLARLRQRRRRARLRHQSELEATHHFTDDQPPPDH